MIQKTAARLIDAGIMTYLVDTRVLMLKKPERKRNRQKLLNFQDFLVNLKIFSVLCGFSVIAFVFELFLNSKIFRKIMKFIFGRKIPKASKTKFAKIHQDQNNKNYEIKILNLNLIEKFRIRNKNAEKIANIFGSSIGIVVDVHQERNLREYLDVFGENVSESDKPQDGDFESMIKMLTTKGI